MADGHVAQITKEQARAGGATPGETTLRWMSCLGGSMAMNIGSGSMFC